MSELLPTVVSGELAELESPDSPAAKAGPFYDPRVFWALAFIPHTFAIIAASLAISRGHGTGNLDDFLAAARSMLKGTDIYRSGNDGYVYPPLIAFLYQPLAMLSQRNAGFVSLAINASVSIFSLIVISTVSVRRILGRVDSRLIATVAMLGAFLTFDKIKGEFCHLETNVFMLLAFTLAMRWVDTHPRLCGMALGFAFNIKYMPLVLVPYLVLRRRWSAIGWFAIWAIAFALLPAMSMGWKANLMAWTEASAGLGNLFGIHSGVARAAHLHMMGDAVSISLTSGIARITGLASPWPLSIAAAIAMLFCCFAAICYRANRMPLFLWPDVVRQTKAPFRGIFSIEWIGMLLLILIFSPFTNSRHLYMLLDVNIAAATLILGGGGWVRRWPLVIAAIIMTLGITFPPGGIAMFESADVFWRKVGGPGWCMLGMFCVLIWTNVRYQRAAVASPEKTTGSLRSWHREH